VKPKEWRIVGHNESEGMKLRNRSQLHRAKASTSSKPVSLHALTGECVTAYQFMCTNPSASHQPVFDPPHDAGQDQHLCILC